MARGCRRARAAVRVVPTAGVTQQGEKLHPALGRALTSQTQGSGGGESFDVKKGHCMAPQGHGPGRADRADASLRTACGRWAVPTRVQTDPGNWHLLDCFCPLKSQWSKE